MTEEEITSPAAAAAAAPASTAPKEYRMTLDDAIADYRSGLISATALVYYYLKIHSAPGYKMTLHQPEISEVLGISKAAFYKAIQRLKDKGLIHKKAPNMLVVALGNGKDLDDAFDDRPLQAV